MERVHTRRHTLYRPDLVQGDYFNNYAPLLIVLFAGCTLLNLGSGLLSCCARCCPCVAAPTFSFDEDFDDTRIDHGAAILSQERQALSEGIPLGTNLQVSMPSATQQPPTLPACTLCSRR